MILVRRRRGQPIFINEDLIESIEATPETLVTLVDGRTYVLDNSPEEVVELARRYRASVLVAAEELRESAPGSVVKLAERPRRETVATDGAGEV